MLKVVQDLVLMPYFATDPPELCLGFRGRRRPLDPRTPGRGPLSDDDWRLPRLASLDISAGGVGTCAAAEHALAAYVASFSACADLCASIWDGFDPLDLDGGCFLSDTESMLNAAILMGM